ncbi:MAG: response regulator [Proteobacteria bacterium]|nr:MAG: response regulator [Pseudomonadota bacterium]
MSETSQVSQNIWVVDDSPTDAERVRRIFADQYEVTVISDGSSALEKLSSGAIPDLLLLDWMMPGISGIEVCQFLRASSGPLKHVPVILLTAQYGPQEIYQAFTSGANDYVSKPFVEEELKVRVASLLESRSLLRRAESAEREVTSLLATAPDPMFAIDGHGRISFVNEEAVRVLKLSRGEILGQEFTALVPGISLKAFGAGHEPSKPIPDVTIDQNIFSPSVRVMPSASSTSTTVALRDVTARRVADSRRLDFYSVIAHDLRTPITSILLRLEIAFRGKHGALPDGHLADLRKTQGSLRGLVGLINDFLELAKLEGVGYRIAPAPLELNGLVVATVEEFQPLLEKGELTWTHLAPAGPARVHADPKRLSQVISNLVGNAIKFTPAKGSIETSLKLLDEHVEFSVSDTGHGVAAKEIEKLFTRYTRASDVPAHTSGTGLGLMIVREIIEAHGGSVGAESTVGQGSRFWFRLPRSV